MSDVLRDEPWDVVVLQQLSQYSGMYATYQPYLNTLIRYIQTHALNPRPTFVWHQTWAYGSGSSHKGFLYYHRSQSEMYDSILQASGQMQSESGIDLIIPSGEVIQRLRSTSLNNPPLDLTRDGYHADRGLAYYALACTWFESLITPVYGVSVQDHTGLPENGEDVIVPVDEASAALCRKIVCETVR